MSTRILVTGASGRLGREVVQALLAQKLSVRAASRNLSSLPQQNGVEPVAMDYADSASVDQALSGIEAAVLIAPALDWDAFPKLSHFIETAAKISGFHVVFISALGVDAVETAPLRMVEQKLFKSGLNWTILRPNFFMDNFIGGAVADSIRNKGQIALATAIMKTSFIAATDIAQVVVRCFADQLYAKELNLTGSEALDHQEVAAMISAAAGKSVSYVDLPPETLNKGMSDAGVPEPVIRYLDMLYGAVRAGYMARITDDVQQITGHAPLTFADFAKLHTTAWK